MKTLGICFGASTVQYAIVNNVSGVNAIEKSGRIPHEGNPQKVFCDIVHELEMSTIDRIAVTGRKYRSTINLTTITEPESIEAVIHHGFQNNFPDLIVSLGGETQLVYKVNAHGGITSVHSGNKCASGTGEFFLQQIRRMGLSLDEAVALAEKGVAHKVAGRCSVFCKSDCTHALNKGEPKENLVAGLCVMIAEKIADLIKDMKSDKVMVVGGGALNTAVIAILKKRFPGLYVPASAAFFEAYGAALWAIDNDCKKNPADSTQLFRTAVPSFGKNKMLVDAVNLVDFKDNTRVIYNDNTEYVLGLDVGSTTTKAVLLSRDTQQIAASVYLRTQGDPIRASRECYQAIVTQINKNPAKLVAIGVTGSGRQIAGLHALTNNVINEIIAHATAAAFYDNDVDTIFEIGGQDAKYTFLTSGIPSDYAMNEACSAGTGSFLEESALESLNVSMEEIGSLAMQAKNPPDFSDQCAAFISSDIKCASQEGLDKKDILAGLVYSICLNYINRVKGSRRVGKKIFMQGGVCYNQAVPVAMASLLNTKIVVPPDPGLMGALGVALEVDKRISSGSIDKTFINLAELVARNACKEGSFICAGGSEKCDRKCEIAKIRIQDMVHPFGGACNKYYNLRRNKTVDAEVFDLVAKREFLLYKTYGANASPARTNNHTVGLTKSFLTHSLYPLYSHFFTEMGYTVVLSDEIDPVGVSRIESAYCLPAEIVHGSFYNLLKKDLDYIFLPQVMQLPVKNVPTFSRLCVFVQGEPYYLKTTFRQEIETSPTVVLSPVLKMETGYMQAEETIVAMATKMGINESKATAAWKKACDMQLAFEAELRVCGRGALEYLQTHPDTFGIVLFGRPYNAFASDANMGIPHKIASRGYLIIPHDMLPSDEFEVNKQMFWAMGQKIMKSAQFVKNHPQLFGVYITNFSCGPDSFLLSFFRNEMKAKPSLTLELDQHTADAGIDTRIEAALDIMKSYAALENPFSATMPFVPARVDFSKEPVVHASDGRVLNLLDENVEVLLPSMGRYNTEGIAAVFRGVGIHAIALPVSDKDILLEGRKNTTCKECLPYILTTGSFLHYIKTQKKPDTVTLCFMASGGGPCRLGQYCTAMEQLINSQRIPNVAMFPLTNENGYAGLGSRALLAGAQAMMVADVFNEIKSFLSVAAQDKSSAIDVLEKCWRELLSYFEGRLTFRFSVLLDSFANKLKAIPLTMTLKEVPVASLIGEAYVRQDEFSRESVTSYLENQGIMVKIAPVTEYLFYSNYVVNKGLGEKEYSLKDHMKMNVVSKVEEWWERRIKTILAASGCYRYEIIHVEKTMAAAQHVINENFRGECILTVGLGLREILNDSCGVISIGPFGCMPSRMAEAILKKEMNASGKLRMNTAFLHRQLLKEVPEFPFLSIETDGTPFSQLIEANLEAFVIQARRVHAKIKEFKKNKKSFSQGMLFSASRNVSASLSK